MSPTRREFLRSSLVTATLGVVAGCQTTPRSAQPATRLPRLGVLTLGAVNTASFDEFRDGLRELGYVENQTIRIEWRAADSSDQLAPMAVELAGLPVDVIMTAGTAQTQAAIAATHTIPIVFGVISDPVGFGIVSSLARPGGNVTGVSDQASQLHGKRLQLLREISPGVSRLLFLSDRAVAEASGFGGARAIQEAAQSQGIQVLAPEIRVVADIASAFQAGSREGVDCVLAADSQLITTLGRDSVAQEALAARLPLISQNNSIPRAGGLAGYGANIGAMYRRSATFVDKILKGGNPAEIPVEQANEFDFAINLTTAAALGIVIPPGILAQATELIQ